MLVMVSARPSINWQPNKIPVAAAGIVATLIFCMALMLIFARRIVPTPVEIPLEVRLISLVEHQHATAALKPVHVVPHGHYQAFLKPVHILKSATIPLQEIEPISAPIDWQQQLEMSVKSQAQANSDLSASPLNRLQAFTPLQQALNAPRKPETMQNGASYRSIYGGVMLKSGGMCSELQTIQVGPSPSNRVTIALLGQHCAGDYQPSMAEELSKWVEQEAKKHPPP
jgi:hypothetical protein